MSAIHQVLLAGSGASYQIQNSLRFRASNSAYLSRSFGSPTSNIKWTWSGWLKRGALGSQQIFCAGDGSSNNFFAVTYTASDTIQISQISSGAYNVQMVTTAVFRDPSAWYHLVVIYDSANATSTDRIQIYVNNSRQTVSYSTGPFGASTACQWNVSGRTHYLRRLDYAALYGDMYAANETFIDGQALTPSSFGQTDATTGVWVPKAYSGTYGTNGFFLQFKDAASTTTIGYDTSGNSNNFTTSGISVTSGTTFDQMLDTPTNNYCTLSPIYTDGAGAISGANLNFNGLGSNYNIASTIGVSSGKWYWEYTGAAGQLVGIFLQGGLISSTTGALSYFSDGNKYTGSTPAAYGASWTGSDVIGIALDLDAGTLTFYKNNVSQGTAFSSLSGTYFPWVRTSTSATGSLNFGQRAFSYTPPSGFKALNTANLSIPVIKKPSLYMDATLRTGTGATASVSSLGFQPDLVWIKSRSAATNHNMFDSGRGVQKGLGTNWSGAEYTDANTLTAFNSNGYSLGSDASSRGVNINTNTYVDWAWKKGATPGFDVVTYTGNATNRTISHGLGVVPEMMLVRTRGAPTGSEPFVVYHSKLNGGTNPANYYLYSTSTAAEAATAIFFNNTMPTSSVFTVGTDSFVNQSGTGIVAYLFAGVEGFSKFGSYVGNASTDGPFVWCGFRPKWIFLKGRNIATSWRQYDAARMPNNEAKSPLYFNLANAESAEANGIDILSNGFKLRWSDNVINGSGSTYIFAAFAEAPFKYARAR